MPRCQSVRENKCSHSKLAVALLIVATLSACTNKIEQAADHAANAQRALDAGQVEDARLAIGRALQQRDDYPEYFLIQGRIEMRATRPERAYSAYANALALDPANQEALQAIASLGLQTGHVNEAEQAANNLLTIDPQQPTALSVKGLLALSKGRFDAAQEYADRMLATSPGNEASAALKARALFMSGKQAEGIAIVEQALSRSGRTAGLVKLRLEMGRAQSDAAVMLDLFGWIKQNGQWDTVNAADKANLLYKIGKSGEARASIEAALLSRSTNGAAARDLMAIWTEHDPGAPAPESLARFIAVPVEVRLEIARYLIDSHRASDALELLNDLQRPIARALKARALSGLGKTRQADLTATEILRDDPGQCDANIAVADIAIGARNLPAAVLHGQQAVAECPKFIGGWLATARAFEVAANDGQAQRVYRDAIGTNPQSIIIYREFVRHLLERSRSDEAVAIARKLTRAAPSAPSSWKLLASACRDKACGRDAADGLGAAQKAFAIDTPSDTRPDKGLYARMLPGKDRW